MTSGVQFVSSRDLTPHCLKTPLEPSHRPGALPGILSLPVLYMDGHNSSLKETHAGKVPVWQLRTAAQGRSTYQIFVSLLCQASNRAKDKDICNNGQKKKKNKKKKYSVVRRMYRAARVVTVVNILLVCGAPQVSRAKRPLPCSSALICMTVSRTFPRCHDLISAAVSRRESMTS